ncbi:MAG: DEAD/DEAH box helicase [Acidobacteria bacterium]|nr:DEAD/DEAH box helicase [Acidobacteriota bacterium]
MTSPLSLFAPPVAEWFRASFEGPTRAQTLGWPAIANGESVLLTAPTGSGKTLTAFLWCINRLMFSPPPHGRERCRVVYVSPLKALAVDVERNLREPLDGIARVALTSGATHHFPAVAIRTGDTPQRERARFRRAPSDILITTPESLYLLLTSSSRAALASVDTVIVDEIHSLVSTKRGAHLALSLERLERLAGRPLQRIGLSATQRPLEEVARFLGGVSRAFATSDLYDSGDPLAAIDEAGDEPSWRRVTVVDTGERKALEISVEVPVEDMASLDEPDVRGREQGRRTPSSPSIWPSIHPRLLELIRSHRTTLLFVNARRVAERLAGALNELAGEELVMAHHGSIAREQRVAIEDALKRGTIRGLVATSTLELGIDMGSIDLVVQIEAPPSVASGMQRIGRGGHQVGETSKGIVFPKFRGDLLASAAVSRAMTQGEIEETRYPRNPLDVLAQQIVAMVAVEDLGVDELYDAIRRAAPWTGLPRATFEQLLDMLSGLYPSDDFAELRPRIHWDRESDLLSARAGARRIAVLNAGTIPDRGLYGVFLAGAEQGQGRVGELDEEMVFETAVGDAFVLGASTWRVEEITRDRVIVAPAPGEPGKMPFWKADSAARPVELGARIGALARTLASLPQAKARASLETKHGLDALAARNLVQYLADQKESGGAIPDDETVVVERVRDELGDWLVCVLSPLGGRVIAPWAMAAIAKVRQERGLEVDAMWSDDGFVIRFPETDAPPLVDALIPSAAEVEELLVGQLSGTSLFAARFRDSAARALLLPRRAGRERTPLWRQRKKASDLLHVAAKFGSFPIVLEAYRECLRDLFDVPALVELMRKLERRDTRLVVADTERPSPFASSLLFRYVANYLYDGDAPLAERRAHALAIDQTRLRELLGEAALRELLDQETIEAIEAKLQRLDGTVSVRGRDALHDVLLSLGDLSRAELALRFGEEVVPGAIAELLATRRALEIVFGGEPRLIAVEDAARYRDGIGATLPPGVAEAFLRPVADPLRDLVSRYARTHGPFTAAEAALRFGVERGRVEETARTLVIDGKVVEGEFRPLGTQREYCHADVLARIRRQSLAKVRREIEPVEPRVFARMLVHWQGVAEPGRGTSALIEAVDALQGLPIAASILESEILPARVKDYLPGDLDRLIASGDVTWAGIAPLGEKDGRIALYAGGQFPLLRREPDNASLDRTEMRVIDVLRERGASFFDRVHEGAGGGFPNDTLSAIWSLVWKGLVTNDSLHALRAWAGITRGPTLVPLRRPAMARRIAPPGSEGRWSVVGPIEEMAGTTERATALAQQLLARYGIVARDVVDAEALRGGFAASYEVLKRMEEAGKIRRGYFVEGIAAGQFAAAGAIDLLRTLRVDAAEPGAISLAATDSANPYGVLLPWPATVGGRGLARAVGARVVLVDGALVAYLYKGGSSLQLIQDQDEARSATQLKSLASLLARDAERGRTVFVAEVNGRPVSESPLAAALEAEGFRATAMGFQLRRKP